MANLTITSTTNSIKVDFGVYSSGGISKGTWRKDKIQLFRLLTDDTIQVLTNEDKFLLVYSSHEFALIVDSVDGIAPTSVSDLYDKLSALVG